MSDFARDTPALDTQLFAAKTNAKAVTNAATQISAADLNNIRTALADLQSYLQAGTLDASTTVTIKDLDLIITNDPAVGPELDWGGSRGRWGIGIDVANSETSKDFVLTFRRNTYSFSDGATTNASPTLTSASGGGFTSSIIGAVISGNGIPSGTTVSAVGGSTSLTMSANAQATGGNVTVTITRAGVQDLAYWKHRGDLSPTLGIGVTPPDGSARLQVSAADNEAAMGTIRIRVGASQTGKALAIHDSTPIDKLWVDKDFYVSGAHSVGGALVLQADVTNARPLILVDNAKASAYGFLYPGGSALRFRYLTGGVDVYQVGSDGSMFFYQVSTFQFLSTFQSGLVNQGPLRHTNEIAPTQITSNQNDYAPTGFASAYAIILTSDASRDVTGFAAPTNGRRIFVYNNGAQNIVLKHDVTSTAANRIIGRGAADTTLTPKTGVILYYSTSITRWIIEGDSL